MLSKAEDTHTSVVVCANAEGTVMIPTLIFQGVRKMTSFMKGYTEAKYIMSESGYMEDNTYVDWAQDFIAQSGGNCVLVVDWHSTRMNLEAIQLFRDANVKVVCLHPHTTHRLQPMDILAYSRLSRPHCPNTPAN